MGRELAKSRTTAKLVTNQIAACAGGKQNLSLRSLILSRSKLLTIRCIPGRVRNILKFIKIDKKKKNTLKDKIAHLDVKV